MNHIEFSKLYFGTYSTLIKGPIETESIQMVLDSYDPKTGNSTCTFTESLPSSDRFSRSARISNLHLSRMHLPFHMQDMMLPGAVLDVRIKYQPTSVGRNFMDLEIIKITLPQRAR